jgi:hypothetical protein
MDSRHKYWMIQNLQMKDGTGNWGKRGPGTVTVASSYQMGVQK